MLLSFSMAALSFGQSFSSKDADSRPCATAQSISTSVATTTTYYKKVTSTNDIVDGGIYLILGYGSTKYYLMGQVTSTGKRRECIETDTVADIIQREVNGSGCPEEITLHEEKTGVYTLQTSEGKYITGADPSKKSNTDLAETDTKDKTYSLWTLTDYSSKKAYAYTFTLSKSSSTRYLAVKTDGFYFGADGYVWLYRRMTDIPIKTEEGYATFYSNKAFTMPQDVTATTVTGLDEEGSLVTPWQYTEGDIVPPNTGLLMSGEPGKVYTCYALDSDANSSSENWLKGSQGTETPEDDDDARFYYLTYSKESGKKTLGFYWMNESGSPAENAGGHAYLRIPLSAAPSQTKGFSFYGSTLTHLQQIEASTEKKTASEVYMLNGQQIGATYSSRLLPGIYIIDGVKTLIR